MRYLSVRQQTNLNHSACAVNRLAMPRTGRQGQGAERTSATVRSLQGVYEKTDAGPEPATRRRGALVDAEELRKIGNIEHLTYVAIDADQRHIATSGLGLVAQHQQHSQC